MFGRLKSAAALMIARMSDERQSPALVDARLRYRQVVIHDRGYLVHWEQDSATYFVTFRLADSLPANLADRSARGFEQALDGHHGPCYLRNPSIATAVADCIAYLDQKRYRLLAWCVMPNHIHMVFHLLPGEELSRVLHSLKSYSAKEANRLLRRTGPFWQREYYDRIIRNGDELDRAIRYVLNNPVNAGLGNWPWVGAVE